MLRTAIFTFSLTLALNVLVSGQDAIVSMDDEPHYSRVFSNQYCHAYVVELGRLEQTKPVAHEHDWVRMTLAGVVEEARGGTVFSSPGYEDPDGYYIHFFFPVDRVTLRNPRSNPYRALIVEIMESDESRNRVRDASLHPFTQQLGPGVDSRVSYVASLNKTNVEIVNVQLLPRDAKEIRSVGPGALFVAMTDVDLRWESKDAGSHELELGKGDVKWLPEGTATFTNEGKYPARFVLLEMK